MKENLTPIRLILKWERRCPGCYSQLDKMCTLKDELSWPDYCVLPINAALTYLASYEDDFIKAVEGAPELTVCWLWRKRKIIYSYDADLLETLEQQEMKDTEILPTELLLHMPYPAVYIKAPTGLTDGFFYWLDYDINTHKTELRLQWVMKDMSESFAQVMHIIPNATIRECVQDTVASKDVDPIYIKNITRAIQLILYLVADNADVSDDMPHSRAYKRTYIKDKVEEIHPYSVGVRIGAVIRKHKASRGTETETVGSQKRPHSRRGHWHHYWAGSKEARRLILKWTAPTYIHADIGETVIYPVK